MVKVKVEVTDGTAAFTTAVCAKSIWQAVRIAEDRYPDSTFGVVFPIEPEGFFVEDPRHGGSVHLHASEKQRETREVVGAGSGR